MEQKFAGLNTFTLLITTVVLLAVGSLFVFFLLYFQRKRYLHFQEMQSIRETYHKNLLQTKLEIQEQILTHISRELHDNISPLISIIQLNLGTPRLKKNPEIQPDIAELKANVAQLRTELKSVSITLNTDHIMHSGFTEALCQELDRIERTGQFKTIRIMTGEKFRLKPDHEIILFRMCQEVLNNIIKHAEATTINVQVNYMPGQFKISITDDGVGFDPSYTEQQRAEKGSTGLVNIYSRAKLINAEVTIDSAVGKGTLTTIIVSAETNS